MCADASCIYNSIKMPSTVANGVSRFDPWAYQTSTSTVNWRRVSNKTISVRVSNPALHRLSQSIVAADAAIDQLLTGPRLRLADAAALPLQIRGNPHGTKGWQLFHSSGISLPHLRMGSSLVWLRAQCKAIRFTKISHYVRPNTNIYIYI